MYIISAILESLVLVWLLLTVFGVSLQANKEIITLIVAILSFVVAIISMISSIYYSNTLIKFQDEEHKYRKTAVENRIKNSFQIRELYLHQYLVPNQTTHKNANFGELNKDHLMIDIISEVDELDKINNLCLNNFDLFVTPCKLGNPGIPDAELKIIIKSEKFDGFECLSGNTFKNRIIVSVPKNVAKKLLCLLNNGFGYALISGNISLFTIDQGRVDISISKKRLRLDNNSTVYKKWCFD